MITKKKESLPNVVFTGPCKDYTRNEITDLLNEYGYYVQSAVNGKTQLLITNNPNSRTTKCAKAKELGVKIVTYQEFLEKKFPEFLI